MLYLKLTESEIATLHTVADSLSIPSEWLYRLIDFESGWNPKARNPYSGATGLIQFMDSTARNMGYSSASAIAEKYPDKMSQLTIPVYRYLKQFEPFPNEQSFAMAVFLPSYRNVPPDTLFPDSVLKVNPGIKTPADYISHVFPNWIPPAIIAAVLIAGLFLYTLSQKGA